MRLRIQIILNVPEILRAKFHEIQKTRFPKASGVGHVRVAGALDDFKKFLELFLAHSYI